MEFVRILISFLFKGALVFYCYIIGVLLETYIENEWGLMISYYLLGLTFSFMLMWMARFLKIPSFIHLITNTAIVGVVYAYYKLATLTNWNLLAYLTDLLIHSLVGLLLGLIVYWVYQKWRLRFSKTSND